MSSDLAEAERLDAFDPLRHFRTHEHQLDDGLVPPQLPSLLNKITQLTFPPSHPQTRYDSQQPSDSTASEPDPDPDALLTVQPTISRIHVRLLLDASPGCGGIAWPAGEVLSTYLARRGPHALRDKNVVELGSGTGLVGLVAAQLGANHVWITDQAPLLGIMQSNVVLNGLAERTSVLEYNWGSPKPDALLAHADLILAADCVYFEPAFPLLVATLADLTAHGDPEILFCYKKRRKADKRFFALLRKHFDWAQVDDDPDTPIYTREAIALLRLTRKR